MMNLSCGSAPRVASAEEGRRSDCCDRKPTRAMGVWAGNRDTRHASGEGLAVVRVAPSVRADMRARECNGGLGGWSSRHEGHGPSSGENLHRLFDDARAPLRVVHHERGGAVSRNDPLMTDAAVRDAHDVTGAPCAGQRQLAAGLASHSW